MNFKTIKEALSQPTGKYFRVRYDGISHQAGDDMSFYSRNIQDEHLTFDISNQKVLANVAPNGSIQFLTLFRGCYQANAYPKNWPGVWRYKDFTKWGPYSFSLRLEEDIHDLSKVSWPYTTALLDNIFPVTTLTGEKVRVTLLTYAPISSDGAVRPRGVVYGCLLENTGVERIAGSVLLPGLFQEENVISRIGKDEGLPIICDIELSIADATDKRLEVPFDLAPGQHVWVPAILYSPGEPVVEEIDSLGSLAWLNSTWTYFRGMTGRLSIPGDTFMEEFTQRSVYQCFGCISMDGDDHISGSSWGTYPPTVQTWMKDAYYSFFPFYMLEPQTLKAGMQWFFKHSLRHGGTTFKGGVTHSLGNALTPLLMAGLYYNSTGDTKFFADDISVKVKIKNLLNQVIESRERKDIWLFPSDLLSDGDSIGDYHTGSNVCAWFAFKACSRIFKEVYLEDRVAEEYHMIAEKVHAAIAEFCVIEGPFGKQYIEGVNADRSVPCMIHDGEESDTTLMSVYGYLNYNNAYYKNFTRFALTEHNFAYNPETKGIRWGMHTDALYVPASFPGYMTGLANVIDLETMNGEQGYMTEIRKLTDVDGSIWWWPYPDNSTYGNVARNNICGKCGWASGVFLGLFVSEILGIRYDAPTRTLYYKPFSPAGSFSWENFRFGSGTFSVSYDKNETETRITVENRNNFSISLNLGVSVKEDEAVKMVLMNKSKATVYREEKILNQKVISLESTMLPGELQVIQVLY